MSNMIFRGIFSFEESPLSPVASPWKIFLQGIFPPGNFSPGDYFPRGIFPRGIPPPLWNFFGNLGLLTILLFSVFIIIIILILIRADNTTNDINISTTGGITKSGGYESFYADDIPLFFNDNISLVANLSKNTK